MIQQIQEETKYGGAVFDTWRLRSIMKPETLSLGLGCFMFWPLSNAEANPEEGSEYGARYSGAPRARSFAEGCDDGAKKLCD